MAILAIPAEQALPYEWVIVRQEDLWSDTSEARMQSADMLREPYDMMRSLGFEWLCYHWFSCAAGHIARAVCVDDYAAPGWSHAYFTSHYYQVDPRLAFVRRHDYPLVWDLPSIDRESKRHDRRGSKQLQNFIGSAASAQFGSGITVGINAPSRLEHVVVTATARERSKAWMTDFVIGKVYSIAIELDVLLAPLLRALTPDNSDSMTLMQRRVLGLLTQGMTDHDIAKRIGVTVRDVECQIRELVQLCRVHNRVQLAYAAGRLALTRCVF
ncbi:LuxR family transcriptional regulator [Trinickia sp. LjRoot230]|uniref:helix-turn-helix transcriptional regulator n=1 Tax=Trinickia sp. LjRoot230 TaxID=3342288 RepID=UPI003ECDECED